MGQDMRRFGSLVHGVLVRQGAGVIWGYPIPDFADRDEYSGWLKDQPHEIVVAMAARSALRVAPRLFEDRSRSRIFNILAALRAILTSGVAAVRPTLEIKDAAKSAHMAASDAGAYSAAFDFQSAALAANQSAQRASRCAYTSDRRSAKGKLLAAANSASGDAVQATIDERYATVPASLSAASADSEMATSPLGLFNKPLWLTEQFENVNPEAIREAGNADPVWRFWADWYDGFLRGRPMDWELQEQIALIPDKAWLIPKEVWRDKRENDFHSVAGGIAKRIEAIQAEFLAAKSPLSERIEFDPEAVQFRRVPISLEKPELIGATLSALEDAWDDVLSRPANGLSPNSREARLIDRTLRKYGNDPQRIEMNLTDLHRAILRQVASEDLPASEENLALQSCAEEGALAIRASHPEVAANREILKGQTWAEVPEDDKAFAKASLPILQAISDDELGEEFAEDIPHLLNDAIEPPGVKAPKISADAATRVFNRAAKMAILSRKERVKDALGNSGKVAKVLYDHPLRKGGTVVIVARTIGEWLIEMVRIGLKMLG